MPIRTVSDPRERAEVEEALVRLRANSPTVAKLKERASRGSLQTNLNTLATESGVKRHRIEKLYRDLAEAANAERGERGTSVPLRKQLDGVRQEKVEAERRLGQSQSINFHLMERIAKFRNEVQLLTDRIAELEDELSAKGPDDPLFMGTDDVIGIPPMPTRKRTGRSGRVAR